MRIVAVHRDADASGVVHDMDVLLLQHGENFIAALVFEGEDAGSGYLSSSASNNH